MQKLIEEFSFTQALIVFIAYIFIDMLYASYILAVNQKMAIRAGLLSSVIYSLLSYGVISYSENKLYLIPLIFGAFIGTYVVVRRS